MTNNEDVELHIDSMIVEAGQHRVVKDANDLIDGAAEPNPFGPGQQATIANGRNYNQLHQVLVLEQPWPEEVTVELYFGDDYDPVVLTRPLEPYTINPLLFPARVESLEPGQYWSGRSLHGSNYGGVFGLDLCVKRPGNRWTKLKPGGDELNNEDYLCWGQPIFAMEEGVVLDSNDGLDDNVPKSPSSDGGNYVWVRGKELDILYTHLQKGSVPPRFLTKGTKVNLGDTIGRLGNSGNSNEPHLHIQALKMDSDLDWDYRPMNLYGAFNVGEAVLTSPGITDQWEPLANRTISTERSLMLPTHGAGLDEVLRLNIYADEFNLEMEKMARAGYYPAIINGYAWYHLPRVNAVFQPATHEWRAYADLSQGEFTQAVLDGLNANLQVAHLDSYVLTNVVHNAVRYTLVLTGAPTPEVQHYVGVPKPVHDASKAAYEAEGFVLTHLSVVTNAGNPTYSARYEKRPNTTVYSATGLSAEGYLNQMNSILSSNQEPHYVDISADKGIPSFTILWRDKGATPGYVPGGLNSEALFRAGYQEHRQANRLTKSLAAFRSTNDDVLYLGIWGQRRRIAALE